MIRTVLCSSLALVASPCLPWLAAQTAPQSPPAGNPPTESRQQALARAMQELESAPPVAAPALPSSGGQLRLIDVSLDIAAAVGTSTGQDPALGWLQGGGHDPKQRGFTLQQAELSIGGAVDPYFTAESHIVFFLDPDAGETQVELEEAFLTTQALPCDLQLKAGTFLTEFGRMNPSHPHAWDWQDQPIILTRVFGEDGMRGPGARLGWLLPTANYTELLASVQNADGAQMTSFLANDAVYDERPIGGRGATGQLVRSFGDMVYSARLQTSWDLSDKSSTALGASVAIGPNASGDGAMTRLYGADFVYKWRPTDGQRGWPFFKLQGEFLGRDFEAGAQIDASDPLAPVALPATTLHDLGGYLQAVYGFSVGWDAGLRAEYVTGSGASYDAGTRSFSRAADVYRADRFRLSPMLEYHPSEFSRIRLQYNYDDTDALSRPVHSVWLGFEMLIGTHPPHKY